MPTKVRPESDILKSVLALLKARGIFALRMQSGALRNPKGRPVRFGMKGMADVLAIKCRQFSFVNGKWSFTPIWIECKREGEKQSPAQREFAAIVAAEGHSYCVVHSADELNTILG